MLARMCVMAKPFKEMSLHNELSEKEYMYLKR